MIQEETLTLTDKQHEVMTYLTDTQTSELLFGGGAGGAKSFTGGYWEATSCVMHPGSRWVMGRSKLKTLEETTLNTFWEVLNIMRIPNTDINYNKQKNVITFPGCGNSQIILKDLFLYPSDPNFDSLGSLEITGAFVDECNQITEKAWNVLKSRIRYKLEDFGLIPKILGTCNPAKNWVFHRFYRPFIDGTLPKNMKFVRSLLDDNPHVSPHYRQNLLTMDKASIERLLHGNWEYDDDPAVLMSFDKIADIFSNDFVIKPGNPKKYIIVDAARFGSNKAVISYWEDWSWRDVDVMDLSSTVQQADSVKRFQKQYHVGRSSVLVDSDGIGGGVVDLLPGCQSFINNSKPVKSYKKGNYANLKSQCAFYLSEKVNANEVYVAPEVATKFVDGKSLKEIISDQLAVVKRDKIDLDVTLRLQSKEIMKELLNGESPDFFDVMNMRSYFDLRPGGGFF